MQISRIRISNILGIDELEFEPGKFTELSGSNGSGKTSVLEAIKAALSGGHDATLLRKGEDKGEIVLVLDDGTEIIKQVKPDTSQTKVKADGKPVSKPAELIKRLTDLLAVNPVEFLAAAKKDRVQILLESMPIQVDTVYLSEISGTKVDAGMAGSGLALIDFVRKEVFDDRTGTNRAAKEKQGTINQLKATVPEAVAEGGDSSGLLEQINAIDARRDAEFKRIGEKLDGFRAERDAKLEELNRQIAAVKDEFNENEKKAAGKREREAAKFAAEREQVSNQLAAIQEAEKAKARYQQTLETVATLSEELATLEQQAETQTQALADIDQYKADLLASLPIPGIEVRDGEIFRDGVQFDRLNTAQQVEIAVEIAKLRSGELGVICCDGLELLDEQRYAAFKEAALKSGLQLFVTRVGDGGFHLTTTDEVE